MKFMTSELDDFLAHYGVMGMKWGVRKDNYSSGYIPKNKIKTPGYSIDKDGRLEIDKGFRIHRMFQEKHSDGSSGSNYFSFTKEDNDRYLVMMGSGVDSRFKFIKNLVSSKLSIFVAKESLRSPSKREAFVILQETLKESKDPKQKPFKGNFEDRGAQDWYETKSANLVHKFNSETKNAYINNLRKKGYNILIDEVDSGFVSELPIIVLDGKKSLSLIGISDISGDEVRRAKKIVSDMDDKPLKSIDDFIKDSGRR